MVGQLLEFRLPRFPLAAPPLFHDSNWNKQRVCTLQLVLCPSIQNPSSAERAVPCALLELLHRVYLLFRQSVTHNDHIFLPFSLPHRLHTLSAGDSRGCRVLHLLFHQEPLPNIK